MPPLVCSQFSPNFLEQLRKFRQEKYLCDCRLLVEGKRDEDQLEFNAHRIVLAASSPFFRDLFLLKRNEIMTTVNLNNCPAKCLEVVLQFLYGGQLHLGDCDPRQVLSVARVCQISSLEKMLDPPPKKSSPLRISDRTTTASPETISQKRKADTPVENGHYSSNTPGSLLKRLCNKHLLLSCNYCCTPTSTSTNNNFIDNNSEVSVPYGPTTPTHSPAMHAQIFQNGQLSTPNDISMALNAMSQSAIWQTPHIFTSLSSMMPKTMPLHLAGLVPQLPLLPAFGSPPIVSPKINSTPNSTNEKTNKSRGVTAKLSNVCSAPPIENNSCNKNESLSLIPSSDKEGWCRNKKYIQRVPSGFMCTVCRKVYGRYNSVSYHVTIYHRNPPIKCDEPGCQFTTREARYIHFHKYYRHGIALPDTIDLRPRSCPFCRHVAKSPAMLEKHVNRHMPDCQKVGKGYKCPQCEKQLSTQRAMAEHILTHSDEKNYPCDQCSYKGRTESNLRQHNLFKHSSDMFKRKHECEICSYSTPTEGNLSAHVRRIHKLDVPPKKEKVDIEQVINLNENGGSPSTTSSDGERMIDPERETPPPPPYPENLSEIGVPSPPPPSYCSSVLVRQTSIGSGDQSDTSLDDSHSDLATATTGYHSMINYGAL